MHSRPVRALVSLALAACAGSVAAAECRPAQLPNEPAEAVRDAIPGLRRSSAVLLRITYSDPDGPPAVETIYVGGDPRFAEWMLGHAHNLRTPCVRPSHPITMVQFSRVIAWQKGFEFGERRLKSELTLAELIKDIRQSRRQPVQLDTRTMGCPFSLMFAPFQPYVPNRVADPAGNPQRAPLVAWLRSVTLNIPDDVLPSAMGQVSFITVPCAVLDLS